MLYLFDFKDKGEGLSSHNRFIKTPIQHAVQYTLTISILYIIYKYFDQDSPKGAEFISYIVPLLFTNIILIVLPVLFVFFYFRDGSAMSELRENLFDKDDPQMKEVNNQEMLRGYHNMLKDGVITQEEYDNIKKKYLKDVYKK